MSLTLEERFERLVAEPKGGCWTWMGSRSQTGYGKFNGLGETLAHRVAYRLFVGPIPTGLTLDHLCRNRACVNPSHLEPVTRRVNILRGTSPQAVNARKDHCPAGHAYDSANTYHYAGKVPARACRTCTLAYQRKKRGQREALAEQLRSRT
jgi:hypothetical protein